MPDSIHKLTDDELDVVAGGNSPKEVLTKSVSGNPADQEKLSKGGKPATGGGKSGPIPPTLGGKPKKP